MGEGAIAWYPMTNKATAVIVVLTYETNCKKENFDLTLLITSPRNGGISQVLPLKEIKSLLREVGPASYDTWQVSTDSGSAAGNTRDQFMRLEAKLSTDLHTPTSF